MIHPLSTRPPRRLALCTALALSLSPLAAAAQDTDGDHHTTDLNAVSVVGHYANEVGTSDAASAGVVLGSMLKDVPLLRPGEVLETIPGMVVTQHSGDGKANQYFLRGYSLDHGTDFATSVDGVPVNMPTNAHGQGYTDLNFLIPELVGHIDYRKGTYDAANGDFSAAGSADIHYRNSLEQPFAQVTFGSNRYRRALLAGSFDLAPGTPGPTLLAAIEGLEQNGPWHTPEDLHKLNALLRLSQGDNAQGWSIDGIAYNAHWNSTDQVPLAAIQSGQLCRFCAIDPTDGGNTGRYILSGEWHASNADGYTHARAYAEHYRLQLFSDFTYFELRPATGDQFVQQESRNLVGTHLDHGWNHPLWGLDSTTEAGLDLRHDHIRVGLANTQARTPTQTIDDNIVGQTEGALYVQNSTSWTDWLRSIVGLRYDSLHQDLTALTLPANTGHASASRILPKLSLIFGPWDKTEFFANIGRGFHSNDARGVIYRTDPTTGEAAQRVPPQVGALGQEIGLRTEIIPGLQSSLAVWRLNSASELVYNAESDIGSTEPNGASKRYGVEWNNHLIVNRWLLFDANLAWTHARYAHDDANGESGQYIPNAVSKVASFALSTYDTGAWSSGIKLRYIGGYPLNQDGSLRGPSSLVTDLLVQRSLTAKASLTLEVLNLFDRKYEDIAYAQSYRLAPDVPTTEEGVTVHPGEPREFRVTLRWALMR